MSADPNKKSARTFQCRDVLWETFEQMARELECSVDYLINEAMKQYARQRSYGGSRTPYPAPGRGRRRAAVERSRLRGSTAPPGARRAAAAAQRVRRGGGPPCASRADACRLRPGVPAPLPAPPPRTSGMPMPPPPGRGGSGDGADAPGPALGPAAAAGPRSVPPPLPRGGHAAAVAARRQRLPARRRRTGRRSRSSTRASGSPITKDRFVIGRGKQSSDLTLKDPNVSRQHAMIEFQNGVYFMVDMGSTNGVEFNGQRIARKQIAEGDVFRICDHDILFTYR